jgi:ATP-dependent Clp protease ATP-binding subunit ClpC
VKEYDKKSSLLKETFGFCSAAATQPDPTGSSENTRTDLVYERFTDRARKVLKLANQEAQRLNHEYIGTEHILLGLVKEGSGVAANVLKNLDIGQQVRSEIEKIVSGGRETPFPAKRPLSPRAKKIVEYAANEARSLKNNYVGTQHLLLALFQENEGVAAQVLMNLGLTLERVRRETLNLIGPW